MREPDSLQPVSLQPGELVVSRNRKWDGSAHWVVPGRYLGEDRHGWWIFQPANEFCSRPGAAFYTASDAVLLVPRTGEYVVTFYDDTYPGDFRVYVDLATGHEWRRIKPGVTEFHVIDMDLAREQCRAETVNIDDVDVFSENWLHMEYSEKLVRSMQAECDALFLAVKGQEAPFDGTDTTWFTRGRA